MSTPSVKLLSHTPHPLETVFSLWHASRTNARTLAADEIQAARSLSHDGQSHNVPDYYWIGPRTDEPFHVYFAREVKAIMALDFPLKETIVFTFAFDDVTITWREQAVRQRKAVAWSQTSRTRPLDNFYHDGLFELPRSITDDVALSHHAHSILLSIQDFYNLAVSKGVPREDARCLQPTCQTHRICFSYNARVLEATMSDRLCFIAQAELWTPIIKGIMREVLRVAPELAILFHPPCYQDGQFRYCPVAHENERRMDGRDPLGPCPLYTMHKGIPWGKVPHRANAEEQTRRILPLWPADTQQAIPLYQNGRVVV
jgi:thymidylate synthase ThyX